MESERLQRPYTNIITTQHFPEAFGHNPDVRTADRMFGMQFKSRCEHPTLIAREVPLNVSKDFW